MSQPATDICTISEQRLKMSYDEFRAWADEATHAEWVDGEVIVFMPPTAMHQRIVGFLYSIMSLYVRLFNLGEVLTAPFEMRAHRDSLAREPDLLFVGVNTSNAWYPNG